MTLRGSSVSATYAPLPADESQNRITAKNRLLPPAFGCIGMPIGPYPQQRSNSTMTEEREVPVEILPADAEVDRVSLVPT